MEVGTSKARKKSESSYMKLLRANPYLRHLATPSDSNKKPKAKNVNTTSNSISTVTTSSSSRSKKRVHQTSVKRNLLDEDVDFDIDDLDNPEVLSPWKPRAAKKQKRQNKKKQLHKKFRWKTGDIVEVAASANADDAELPDFCEIIGINEDGTYNLKDIGTEMYKKSVSASRIRGNYDDYMARKEAKIKNKSESNNSQNTTNTTVSATAASSVDEKDNGSGDRQNDREETENQDNSNGDSKKGESTGDSDVIVVNDDDEDHDFVVMDDGGGDDDDEFGWV